MHLLRSRSFLPIFLTQFFGAFNDNAFKLAMLTLISYYLSTSQTNSEQYQSIASILFMLPFFVFSAISGQLADTYDKGFIIRLIKISEVLLMCVGSVALFKGSIFFMLLTLTGLGVHSTFFGPIKYAILLDHLPRSQLLTATGYIEASTFVAILAGTILGTLSIGNKDHVIYAIFLINFSSICGLIASLFILPAPPAQLNLTKVNLNIWCSTLEMIKKVSVNKQAYPVVLLISWFWLIGAVVLIKLPDYSHFTLGANTTVFAMFLAIFSIGIAIGSLAIIKILAGKITLRYVPAAMFLLTLFALDLYWASPSAVKNDSQLINLSQFLSIWQHWRITIDFFLFSFCGGLFVVPLYTYLQAISKESHRAQTIAANNIYNALAMVLGSLIVIVMLKFNLLIKDVFLFIALTNIFVTIIINRLYKISHLASP
ncbi:MFS transporter [Legionella sp. D16C41]|uniref:MFS transporter n=1 Tax=Legionella sp. D16C41 TaxID=3402688 RepID=UPI003AF8ACC1